MWDWTAERTDAFETVKADLCRPGNLLAHCNPEKEVILSVDASPVGVGAVISHEEGGVD